MNAFAWNSKQLIRGIHPSLEIMLILRFHFSAHFVRGRVNKVAQVTLTFLNLLLGGIGQMWSSIVKVHACDFIEVISNDSH